MPWTSLLLLISADSGTRLKRLCAAADREVVTARDNAPHLRTSATQRVECERAEQLSSHDGQWGVTSEDRVAEEAAFECSHVVLP
jgi:hypothetical protein